MSIFLHTSVNYKFPCCGTNGKHSLRMLFDKGTEKSAFFFFFFKLTVDSHLD